MLVTVLKKETKENNNKADSKSGMYKNKQNFRKEEYCPPFIFFSLPQFTGYDTFNRSMFVSQNGKLVYRTR